MFYSTPYGVERICIEYFYVAKKMKKIIIITTLVLLTTLVNSQDSLWQTKKIDENLTISLPNTVEQIDTSYIQNGKKIKFKIFAARTEFSGIGVTVSNEHNVNIDNKETLLKALSEIAKGAIKSLQAKGLKCVASDTLIQNIPCKKLKCEGELNEIPMNILHYTLLVNDKVYIMQAAFVPEFAPGALSELDRLLGSVHFEAKSIKELQFESKALSDGYKVGYVIGMLIIPALIICLIIYFVRKGQQRKKINMLHNELNVQVSDTTEAK